MSTQNLIANDDKIQKETTEMSASLRRRNLLINLNRNFGSTSTIEQN